MQKLDETASRIDFGIGEDCNTIVVAGRDLVGSLVSAKDRNAAAQQNRAFLLPLPEDGGISGRLILGPLNEHEEQAWMAKATRMLELEDDVLMVDAGGYFSKPDLPATDAGSEHLLVEVQAGTYALTVYHTLNSNHTTDMFRRSKISYLTAYKQSFPGTAIPEWVIDLAEDRDNEVEEEQLEELDSTEVDCDSGGNFVEVLFQLTPVSPDVQESSLLKSGGPKWEKRPFKAFPTCLPTEQAERAGGVNAQAKKLAKAFRRGDLAEAAGIFPSTYCDEVREFLEKRRSEILAKMSMLDRVNINPIIDAESGWRNRTSGPRAIVFPELQSAPFHSSLEVDYRDSTGKQPLLSIRINLAFVATSDGPRPAGLAMYWDPPKTRPVRRRRR